MPNAAGAGPYYLNNLVYANTSFGILLRGGRFAVIENNTVYQPTGDAIRLQDVAAGTPGAFSDRVANNIFVVGSGYAMRVDSATLTGLVWDYNDIFVTGTGNSRGWTTAISSPAPPGSPSWASTPTRSPRTRSSWTSTARTTRWAMSAASTSGVDDDFHVKLRPPRSTRAIPTRRSSPSRWPMARGSTKALRQHQRGRHRRGTVRPGAAPQWS